VTKNRKRVGPVAGGEGRGKDVVAMLNKGGEEREG